MAQYCLVTFSRGNINRFRRVLAKWGMSTAQKIIILGLILLHTGFQHISSVIEANYISSIIEVTRVAQDDFYPFR